MRNRSEWLSWLSYHHSKLMIRYPAMATREAAQNTVTISDAITRRIARRPFQVTRADNRVGAREVVVESVADMELSGNLMN
jgi:hypothetical protein